MPKKISLPGPANAFLSTPGGQWCRNALTVFHRWMGERGLELSSLTPTHIDQFWQQQAKGLADASLYTRRCLLHKYIYWLSEQEMLHFSVDPPRLRHMRRPLPESAQSFLDLPGNSHHAHVVRNLHDWLQRKQISLDEITPAHIKVFLLSPITRTLTRASRKRLHRRLEPYLLWLHRQGLVRFKTDRGLRPPFPLPDTARAFIDTLRPVRKSSSCRVYETNLRDLYAWLTGQGHSIDTVDRAAMERWLKSMSDRGLAPCTRSTRIMHVRAYFVWLTERGQFDADPDELLRTSDLPKLPSYLPRPFPVEEDRALQQRFLKAGTVHGQALLLMRRSGVRVGELVRLEPRCMDEDLKGNAFLKVPLGKLDNERLVPLDAEAIALLRSLQRLCPPKAFFLLLPELSRDKLKLQLSKALKEAAAGLDIPGPVVSHRLRHSYATELLNAGMSLVSIMKLLGHRSLSMTMRYAAITQKTVVKDYHAALAKIGARYDLPASPGSVDEPDPDRMLQDIISYLRNHAAGSSRANKLIARLHNLRRDISALMAASS